MSNGGNALVLPRPNLACLKQHHQTALSSPLLFLKELPLACYLQAWLSNYANKDACTIQNMFLDNKNDAAQAMVSVSLTVYQCNPKDKLLLWYSNV